MRNFLLLLSVTCLVGATCFSLYPTKAFAGPLNSRDGDDVILIHPLPNNPIGGPRTPSSVSIEAALDTELYVIDVRLQNAGTSVTVDIENTTTGTTYQYHVSGDGADFLPISSTSGYWTITFTLQDGRVYGGCFMI